MRTRCAPGFGKHLGLDAFWNLNQGFVPGFENSNDYLPMLNYK